MAILTHTFAGGRVRRFYDEATGQTVAAHADWHFYDDFFGNTLRSEWTAKDVSATGDTLPTFLQDTATGALQAKLDATNEAQASGLFWNDNRCIDAYLGAWFETRIRLTSSDMTGINMRVGLCSDWSANPANVTESIWGGMDETTAFGVETDDGATDTNLRSVQDWTSGDWHIFACHTFSWPYAAFYFDGVQIGGAMPFDLRGMTPTTRMLQPVLYLRKASGTTLATLDIDRVRIFGVGSDLDA